MHTGIEINYVVHVEAFVYQFPLHRENVVHICTYWGLFRGTRLHE